MDWALSKNLVVQFVAQTCALVGSVLICRYACRVVSVLLISAIVLQKK